MRGGFGGGAGVVTLAVGALALCAIGAAVACDDANIHVFSAQLYEQASDCLDDYAAIEVVPGDNGSATCSPVCLVGAGAYYVSTMCPPYPDSLSPPDPDAAPDPVCVAALAANAAQRSCSAPSGDDGGDDGGEAGDDGGGDDGGGDDGGGDDGGGDAPADGGSE